MVTIPASHLLSTHREGSWAQYSHRCGQLEKPGEEVRDLRLTDLCSGALEPQVEGPGHS